VTRVQPRDTHTGVFDDEEVAPRDWLDNPDLYGKTGKATWRPRPADPLELAAYSAAYLQHMFACQVEQALRDDGTLVAELADATGLNRRHLSHILRGRQTISWPATLAIVRALDRIELLPAPSAIADLTP
jgi:hypothetical protein